MAGSPGGPVDILYGRTQLVRLADQVVDRGREGGDHPELLVVEPLPGQLAGRGSAFELLCRDVGRGPVPHTSGQDVQELRVTAVATSQPDGSGGHLAGPFGLTGQG